MATPHFFIFVSPWDLKSPSPYCSIPVVKYAALVIGAVAALRIKGRHSFRFKPCRPLEHVGQAGGYAADFAKPPFSTPKLAIYSTPSPFLISVKIIPPFTPI